MSEHAARLVTAELEKHAELQTELIDIAKIACRQTMREKRSSIQTSPARLTELMRW